MSWWRVSAIVAAASFAGLMASPVSAAPPGLGVLKPAIEIPPATKNVHWRRYRHCHRRRYGRRRCHGRRRYRYYDYGWPGIGLYFGFGKRHHRHHRHHRRHRRH